MVATISTLSSETILSAVKKAGFVPKTLGLHETARQKFTRRGLLHSRKRGIFQSFEKIVEKACFSLVVWYNKYVEIFLEKCTF